MTQRFTRFKDIRSHPGRFHYRLNSVRHRYTDETAATYDRKREKRRKWKREMNAVSHLVSAFTAGSSVLDAPVGTGRFIPTLLETASLVYGMDISRDMLAQSRAKADDARVHLLQGDAIHIPLADGAVDYVICIRLLNWVQEQTMEQIVREFRRVARRGMVIGFRSRTPMTRWDMVRSALFAPMPTPHHMRRWLTLAWRLANRTRGKLAYEFRRIQRRPHPDLPAPPHAITMQHFLDERRTLEWLAAQGFDLVSRLPIDKMSSLARLELRPYSIYYFTKRGSGESGSR